MHHSDQPSYYRRLVEYFPQQELKPLTQFTDLLSNQPCYRKLETSQYVLLYAEFTECLFVDFMLVDAQRRNSGIGSRILDHLKAKGIPIVLEVEPEDTTSRDTVLRRKFYLNHHFRVAEQILYRRINQQGKPFDMDIFFWSPSEPIPDEQVIAMMTQVCNEVHNFRAMQHYGRLPADPARTLSLRRMPVGKWV